VTTSGRALVALPTAALLACVCTEQQVIPHQGRFGIYALRLESGAVRLLWSTDDRISGLALNQTGDRFALSRRYGTDDQQHEEICTIAWNGSGFTRLTDNDYLDTYPVWSPDGTRLGYLSWPDSTLDIYVMRAAGDSARLLFDSGSHDGDPSWVGSRIAFTSGSRVWMMDDDGTNAAPVTDPPRAGEMGSANLPFGDYDPRLRPDGARIVFERLVDDRSASGNYDLFLTSPDGTGLLRLTTTGFTQGMANWSRDGERLVFVVAAVGETGQYRIWQLNADGSDCRNITPDYFPQVFLCHDPLYSADDSEVCFIGEWWQ
jgi:Tol biopolymer transport system component